MCLNIDREATNKAKNKKTGFSYRYKVLQKETLSSLVYVHKYKPGWNKADNIHIEDWNVYNSIHVYTTKEKANYENILNNDTVVVRFKCYNKDLVAVGFGREMAYSKVWLDRQEYEKKRKIKC